MEQNNALGLLCETFLLNPGASLLVPALPGQMDVKINFMTGGSMALSTAFPIFAYGASGGGATMATGLTLTQALAIGISALMPLVAGTPWELKDYQGPFALVAYGATATCALARRFRPGLQTSYPA